MPAGLASSAPSRGAESVARIVHDLHAPLTVIRGLCATLRRDEQRPERLRAISLIDGEALRLAAGLAGLASASAGGSPGVAARVDLVAVAARVGERFSAIAAERQLTLEYTEARAPVLVVGDPRSLERVIENLLGNAVRHCEPGGRVELSVAVRRGRAVLRVRDDGGGVRACDRDAIFRAGERGSAPRGSGHGLGLAIAREIAEAHGGRLTVDSVGTGACFRLSLPICGVPDDGRWVA